MPIRRALGQAVRALRKREELKQGQLGLDRSHLANIEAGKVDPSLSTFKHLAEALHVTPVELLEETLSYLDPAPAGVARQMHMLDDGILVVEVGGRLNAAGMPKHQEDILGAGEARGARKMLVDMSACQVELEPDERYQVAREAAAWLDARGYAPEIALVASKTAKMDAFGAGVARDHGMKIQAFDTYEEALAYLRALPAEQPPG